MLSIAASFANKSTPFVERVSICLYIGRNIGNKTVVAFKNRIDILPIMWYDKNKKIAGR